jgi:hypothetical protein
MTSLNLPFTRLSMRRRYESWFLRFGLADGAGAWWLRYLLANPGRQGCPGIPGAAPVQVKLRESCRDPEAMRWAFQTTSAAGSIEAEIEGGGSSLHRLPYAKTDCSGNFEVANNSLARARLKLRLGNPARAEELVTDGGSVLEMTGEC